VEENQKLTGINQAISVEIDRLKHDPAYIESIARQELGMIGENEIILKPRNAPQHEK
jgi:cell division protein FtsB